MFRKTCLIITFLVSNMLTANAESFLSANPDDVRLKVKANLIALREIGHCSGCDFVFADLNNHYLPSSLFNGADFSQSNLSGASMFNSMLKDAIFVQANLSGVNLKNANLIGADFSGANLTGADLSGAIMNGATLCNTTMPDAQVLYSGC